MTSNNTVKIQWCCPLCGDDDYPNVECMTHHLVENHRVEIAIMAQLWYERAKVKQEQK